MTRRGTLRWSEEQFAADAASRGRWKSAPVIDQPTAGEARAAEQSRIVRQTPSPCRGPIPLEADVLRAVLAALELHPKVAWAVRINTGAARIGEGEGRFVRFGFKGCSDILGQLEGGRLLAVEVKRPGGRLTADQSAFLARVRKAGGVAFMARGVDDVARGLA